MNLNKVLHVTAKSLRRLYSSSVRVRFAPSPTGYLHLGGLRTAVYNYLFSRSRGGAFVLRIEDTDQTRMVEGTVAQLQTDLRWAGVEVDEGPDVGGDYGPYVQSQRLDLYNEHVRVLLENGSAYRCFCTERRLGLLRREALRLGQVPKYDNRCRDLTEAQVQNRLARNDKCCVRFKLQANCETFDDLIFGNIAYDVALNEGDPVILKSDGFPTYHFANVVDDHLMKISHVLRGVEWQISTTKHILMYRAFGWEPPVYGHLPLLLNADGKKFSKRQGDVRIAAFRDDGIYPQALLNFLTSCGGGFRREEQQAAKPQLRSMDQLIKKFDVGLVNVHSTRLMFELLPEYNRLALLDMLNDRERCASLVRQVQQLVRERFQSRQGTLRLEDEYVKQILKWSTTRITKASDLISEKLVFLWVVPTPDPSSFDPEHVTVLQKLCGQLRSGDCDVSGLRAFADSSGLRFGELMRLLRKVLCGLEEGPGVLEVMEILGMAETVSRLQSFLAETKNHTT